MAAVLAGCGSGSDKTEAPTYSVGGTVSGLAGTGLAVALDGNAAIAIDADGSFTFPTKLASGAAYSVSVTQQPIAPTQDCVVTAGSGTIAATDATDIVVTCTTQTFQVTVEVAGLLGATVVLQLGPDSLPLSANGMAPFPTRVTSGAPYSVLVTRQPSFPYQHCAVASQTGVVGSADLVLAVTCSKRPQLAVGGHSCVVRTDGTLWCWGANSSGQLGDGTTTFRASPLQIGSETTWAEVAVGRQHTCAVRLDGTLWCWGDNRSGALGNGSTELSYLRPDTVTPEQVGSLTSWRRIVAGEDHTCATRSNSSLWCWGKNTHGELLIGTSGERTSPTQALTGLLVVDVAAGSMHTCALSPSGTVSCAGGNYAGQIGSGPNVLFTPQYLTGGKVSLSAGGSHTCALGPNGALECWGIAIGPGVAMNNTTWASMGAGPIAGHACAVRLDGTLWCWGANSAYQLGDGTKTNRSTPIQIGSAADWLDVRGGAGHTCALALSGALWCWGSAGALGLAIDPAPGVPEQLATDVASVSSAEYYSCMIRNNGTLWCWGTNGEGVLGTGDKVDVQVPVQAGTATTWAQVAAGGSEQGSHVCAIQTNGTLWCWGNNRYGALGDGYTAPERLSPFQIGTVATWATVTSGGLRSCATRTDGTVWCWGDSQLTPAQVGSASTWASVSAGARHTCGIHTTGTLWCWGDNEGYRLGDGTTTSQATPIQIGSATTWSMVRAGYAHTCAIQTNGTLWCWGSHGYGGGLGGANPLLTTPTQIGSATTWASVATAQFHTCATQTDGSLWCWGSNSARELGDPALPQVNVPTQIGSNLTWSTATAAAINTVDYSFSCGLRSDASLWCWGDNTYGQLGPNHLWRSTPTQVW